MKLSISVSKVKVGTLKTLDWKTRDHEKYVGGKRRTGKHGTKAHGWNSRDWKTQDQISRVENARPPSIFIFISFILLRIKAAHNTLQYIKRSSSNKREEIKTNTTIKETNVQNKRKT